ncbi:MAG: 1-deoxy-D-xylulose-5-phosphate reductoisomerase [Candidatus Eremiobacterota bacterium]
MKTISILGSTGSIGRQTLEVISAFPEKFRVTGLAAGNNIELLAEQIKKFRPEIVSVGEEKSVKKLKALLGDYRAEIYFGTDGLIKVASYNETELVVLSVVGHIGLLPAIKAIEAGKDIALANKETLVTGGELIDDLLKKRNVNILPVDSEHSAIFQCIAGNSKSNISRILLTASGGPFRYMAPEDFRFITPEDALAHPTWNMGKKVTVDSATLMNKGFEVIEARWLFNVPVDNIHVLIHPQSIVHSLVEFKDKSVMAQLSPPDMRLPIQYALTYPERWDGARFKSLDLLEAGRLEFYPPDTDKFPCLSLAYKSIKEGGTRPAVLNAVNEVAVSAFLEKKLLFNEIPVLISQVLKEHKNQDGKFIEHILQDSEWAMKRAKEILKIV